LPVTLEYQEEQLNQSIPNVEAMENLKFSECLSSELAIEVFMSRFNDPKAVSQAVEERRRVVVQNEG
jgi:hypothetical protein